MAPGLLDPLWLHSRLGLTRHRREILSAAPDSTSAEEEHRRILREALGVKGTRRAWFAAVDDEEIFLSVLTVGDLRLGVEGLRRRDPAAAALLDSWLARVVETHRDRLVPVDRLAAEEWGRMNVPDLISVVDGLPAATAKTAGMTLVTRNVADVERTGADYLDPFAA